jgi:hypothetical protein
MGLASVSARAFAKARSGERAHPHGKAQLALSPTKIRAILRFMTVMHGDSEDSVNRCNLGSGSNVTDTSASEQTNKKSQLAN